MSEPSHAASGAPSFSVGRVLLVAVPLALLMWGANRIYSNNVQEQAEQQGRRRLILGLFGDQDDLTALAPEYQDADGDLLADSPADDKALDPAELKFSFVATSSSDHEQQTWQELLAALSETLGRKVSLVSYADTAEQLRALKAGDLHITAFSTGETPGAVNEAGFIPLVCAANADGDYRITMKIIVPADSPIKTLDDLKGRRMTFVRPRSNSGCTAALVMLMDEHDLQPERDYAWGFSYGHDASIRGIADRRFEAAAVASDILDRMTADGDVQADAIRTVYESEPFPPGVIGYAHNLKSELRDKIRQTLLEFEWAGTGVEKEFKPQGAVKFAEVDYKRDWAPVRQVREAGGALLAQLSRP